MICLTSDIHHCSLRTENQRHCAITELETAQRFLKILEEREIKATFFISGKCFTEQWNDVRPLVEHPLVEVGGHNFSCLTPMIYHRVWNKLTDNYNGPGWYQRRDALATKTIIHQRTGRRIRSWRNHMYMHGPHTEKILRAAGFTVCSDGVRKDSTGPEIHPTGLLNWPLNVMPDHEHLYHAERSPEWVEKWAARHGWSDDFGSRSYYIDEWVERVLQQLRDNEQRGVISNMLIHPITMYLCDGFSGFERIADYLAERQTEQMGTLCDRALSSVSELNEADDYAFA